MTDWSEKELGEILTLNYGWSLPEKKRVPGAVPVYGSNGIVGRHNEPLVDSPGLIVGRKGSAGNVHFSRVPFCPIDTTFYVAPDETTLDLEFLYYLLLHLDLKRILGDVGVPGLNREMAYKEKARLPDAIEEQRKIAAVLGLVQRAIEQQERLITLTAELKKTLLHKLFTDGLRGEPQKQTEIGPVPESWEVLPLEKVILQKIVDGVHKTPKYIDTGVPFITAKDIIGNRVCFDECRYISLEEHKQLTKRVRPQRGDVFLTKVGTVGNVGIVDFDEEFSFFVQLALIRPNPDQIASDYLYWVLQVWSRAI